MMALSRIRIKYVETNTEKYKLLYRFQGSFSPVHDCDECF